MTKNVQILIALKAEKSNSSFSVAEKSHSSFSVQNSCLNADYQDSVYINITDIQEQHFLYAQ